MKDRWKEVMKLAEKYGFITTAAGGVAILMCHEVQKEQGIFEMTQYKNGLAPHPSAAENEVLIS